MTDGSIVRIASMVRAKWFAPPSFKSSRATAVTTTCFNFIRRTASATRCGSSSSRANGFAVVTAQNPQARVQRSPAIIKVAVPWLQHSQRFGHCALSQTVCNRKSEISAFVEKKMGFDGSRTLIQGGFCAWCNSGSIFAQDIEERLVTGSLKSKLTVSSRASEGPHIRGVRYTNVCVTVFETVRSVVVFATRDDHALQLCAPRKRGGKRQFISRCKPADCRNARSNTG